MNKIEKICKKCNCKHFIVWSFGFGDMYSCKLQGQSEHIKSVAKDCPFKDKFRKTEENLR